VFRNGFSRWLRITMRISVIYALRGLSPENLTLRVALDPHLMSEVVPRFTSGILGWFSDPRSEVQRRCGAHIWGEAHNLV
jgi:hypothetical protein